MEEALRRLLPSAALGMSVLAWVVVVAGIAYATLFVSNQVQPMPRGITSPSAVAMAIAIYAGLALATGGVVTSLICVVGNVRTKTSLFALTGGLLFFAAFVTVWMGAWTWVAK